MLDWGYSLINHAISAWHIILPTAIFLLPFVLSAIFPFFAKTFFFSIRVPIFFIAALAVWVYISRDDAHDHDYARMAEISALKAQIAEQDRQAKAISKSLEEAKISADNAKKKFQAAKKSLSEKISKDTDADGAVWQESDIKWLKNN